MKSGIEVDISKCIHCASCVKDCMVKALKFNQDTGFPEMVADGVKLCINCQHCLAVCPAGALSVNGVSAGNCHPVGALPDKEAFLNLIRQRRSVRRFKKEPLNRETLDILKNVLHWTPTGCNDHRLQFFIAGKEEIAEFRKVSDRWLRFLIKSGLMSLLVPRYRRYFDYILSGADIIYREAPHLIVVMAPAKSPCCKTDQVIALTQFDLMAQTLGVSTCWCGFAEYAFRLIPQLRKMIGCPRGYRIGGVMLFGKPAVKYFRATQPPEFIVRENIVGK